MSKLVDNLLAFRIISMIAQRFDETDAYKLGIIDAEGKNLIPSSKLSTGDQKDAYTYLHRLVFNVKKLINKLPGGENKLKNVVSAYFLVKEAYENENSVLTEERLIEIHTKLQTVTAVEEFLIAEMVAANNVSSGNVAPADQPVIKVGDIKRYKTKHSLPYKKKHKAPHPV